MTRWASAMDVSVYPNPVLILDQKGTFRSNIIFPPWPEHNKSDSLTFTYTIPEKHEPLGIVTFHQSDLIPQHTLRSNDLIEFEYESVNDSVPIFIHLTLYKNHKMKTGPKLQVARLIKAHE